MSDLDPAGAPPEPPVITDPTVAAALEQVRDLDALPVTEHHDRLVGAHQVLHDILHAQPATS